MPGSNKNAAMILHLLKTDWQRLKRLVFGVWLLLALTTLPWLLLPLDSFRAPWFDRSNSQGDLPAGILGSLFGHAVDAEAIRYLSALATLILSTAIGMHGVHWQVVSPLRRWQRITAKLLSLLLFLVVPQSLLGMTTLHLHGFPAATVAAAGLGTAASLILIHAASALFAHCCGSLWTWLASLASLVGTALVLSLLTGVNFPAALHPFVDPWAAERGVDFWVLGGTAVVLLSSLPKLVRSRPRTPLAAAAAVSALILAAVPAHRAPGFVVLPSPSLLSTDALAEINVELVAKSLRIDDDFYGGMTHGAVRAIATVRTAGELPPKTHVAWSSGVQSKQESRYWTRAYPNERGPTDLAAMTDALPAPLIRGPEGIGFGENSVTQVFPNTSPHPSRDLRLSVHGHVFRYEPLAELPFDESTVITRDGSHSLATRRVGAANNRILLDVAAQSPALGISRDPRIVTESTPHPIHSYRFVLHLPKDRLCVPLMPTIDQAAFIPGGAGWSRRILVPWEEGKVRLFDFKNARLIILKPITLARINREIAVTTDLSEMDSPPDRDWMLSRNYGLRFDAYIQNHRPCRPDPATCTDAEFARYLRTISASFFDNLAEQDLAEYAPRFSELLALHAPRSPAVAAIERGTPDSRREEVLHLVRRRPSLAPYLAPALVSRGWQAEVKDSLLVALRRPASADINWNQHRSATIEAIALLEDPATYPALLSILEKSRSLWIYETLRQLPGIEPLLDDTIRRMSQDLSPAVELSRVRQGLFYGVFDAFTVPLAHGDPLAMEKLLELWRMLPSNLSAFDHIRGFTRHFAPGIPSNVGAWRAFIEGKTSKDFAHDPLTRTWHLVSKHP